MTPASRERPTLLVLRALGIGDLLTAVPALRALADAFPSHRKVLATPAWLAPLVTLIEAVDEVVPTEPLQPIPPLRARPDVAVNMHGRGPESHRVLAATRPTRTIAYANPAIPESMDGPVWRDDEHEVVRWCRMLVVCGIPADPQRLILQPPRDPAPVTARGATLLHPGTSAGARRWPAERWVEVARAEMQLGHNVIITGSAREVDLANRIAQEAGVYHRCVYAGATDVLDLAGLVAAADRVVSCDTGVGHLATAFGVPSVLIFGPTPPMRWGPYVDRALHRVLWAGRTGDPLAEQPHESMSAITVEQVLEALRRLPPRHQASGLGTLRAG